MMAIFDFSLPPPSLKTTDFPEGGRKESDLSRNKVDKKEILPFLPLSPCQLSGGKKVFEKLDRSEEEGKWKLPKNCLA